MLSLHSHACTELAKITMYFTALLPLVLACASAALLPRQAATTNATLYVGSQTCGAEFTLTSELTEGVCTQLIVMSYRVQDLPTTDCTFHSYTGKACETESGTTAMPAGDGSVCITGVVDGGTGPGAGKSGMFTCP